MSIFIMNLLILWLILTKFVSSDISVSEINKNLYGELCQLFKIDINEKILCGQCDEVSQRHYPEIGNGHIATQIRNSWIFMNGLYNGYKTNSHRAAIPSTLDWSINTDDHLTNKTCCLDPTAGIFHEIFSYKNYNVTITTYISRTQRQLLVRNVSLSTKSDKEVDIYINGNKYFIDSPDIDFKVVENKIIIAKGLTKEAESDFSDLLPIVLVTEKLPKIFKLNSTNKWKAFLTSIDINEYNAIGAFFNGRLYNNQLLVDHIQGWLNTWKNGFISTFAQNISIDLAITAAQYYLLSSLPYYQWRESDPYWKFYGVSPTGLAHGSDAIDYLGHVFWDMETWIYPALLPFQRNLAISMLDYRLDMLESAILNSITSGYKGARYPWESARTGIEVTPSDLCAHNEVHITGDISLAMQQLLWFEKSSNLDLYNKYKPAIKNIAIFWESRLTYNKTKKAFEINNVMPPDEFVRSCNNSAYTNEIASLALKAPIVLATRYKDVITADMERWFKKAQSLFISFNKDMNLVNEYEGYSYGQIVKQADVILLQYPLYANYDTKIYQSNLEYYAGVTHDNGPAMTWSIFSINHFKLNNTKMGMDCLLKNLQYIIKPFYIWSETPYGHDAVNFHTGMGGFLQNIIYGIMGLEILHEKNGILQVIPQTIMKPLLFNVTFQGCQIMMQTNDIEMVVQLLNNAPLMVMALQSRKNFILDSSSSIASFPIQKVHMQALNN